MEKKLNSILIIMGVAGCGKTVIGKMLANSLNYLFVDADEFHSHEHKAKMSAGISLTDSDRKIWLNFLHEEITKWQSNGLKVVLACSALKESYRINLAQDGDVHFIYLKGSKELISQRLKLRQGHFVDQRLLDSQFDTLEEPRNATTVAIDNSPESIVKFILQVIM